MTDRTPPPRMHILLVEDNPMDVTLIREAFFDQPGVRITVASDGEEALERVRGAGGAERPDLVLLDLHLPGKTGLDVLREIKEDEDLRALPVLVLSGSREASDVTRAYDAHANSYLPKPIGVKRLLGMAKAVEDYWMLHARLPPKPTEA